MTTTAAQFPITLDTIAGLSIAELAEQFGTPFYAYDAAKIVERIDDLAPFDVVRFAQKACSNLAILAWVRKHGVVVDAVSAGEVRRALAAGYDATEPMPGQPGTRQIVYTADLFDREALDLVVEHDLPVNCGSPQMIDQYGERCQALGRERGVTLRINPGFGHGHSQKTNTGGEQSKHGIWHEQVADCVERAAKWGLSIEGLHMHIGSGTDLEHLGQVCGAMEKIALEVGPSVHSISAGGGLPTPYRDGDARVEIAGYHKLWDATRDRLAEAFGHAVSLEIEPGRYLTAESGSLVAEVRTVKQMGSNLYYLVDAGFNNLARPILYGSYHPMAICHTDPAHAAGGEQDAIVGGPLCESGDIFTQEEGGFVSARRLPHAEVGDLLVIGCAGAYGYVMSSNYNSKPMAPEVMIVGGKAELIRERQTFEDIVRGENVPQWD
ncbi:Diaminopimelate decarboxylase [Pseudobythopirellula maris]|uniref:Diaminopimelate decarboxylase n=1 Tax=Pseudobythopirellula maris TaxID=2527991 RepID=A0A5C5ZTZ2_9BACT|nr:diaminopimelate decarboxylase [Pseudobythopirellula maris]TWT90899.1 Diaminopimelate decarboxylase [Pseudobythopirellula maris]